jgi:hypothetical protein
MRSMNFISRRTPGRILKVATATVCGLCAVMLWVVLWGSPSENASTAAIADQAGSTGQLSESPTTSNIPKSLSTSAANSIALGLERDTVRYYEPTTGRAFIADLRKGHIQVISDRKLSGFIRSWWFPGGNKVVSSFDQRGTVEYRSYDYVTKAAGLVGNAVVAITIAPDGHHMAYADTMGDALGLFVAKPDGTNARQILTTRTTDIQLDWPTADFLALSSRRPDRTGRDLTLVRMDGTLEALIPNRENLEYVWSRDGGKLLFSYFLPGEGVSLWYRDLARGSGDLRLNLATSARKCAWHSNGRTITCGVPNSNNLSGDIPADRVATTDDIVTLDIGSGQQTKIFTAKNGSLIGVVDPLISSSGRYLVFPNVFDQRPYALEI